MPQSLVRGIPVTEDYAAQHPEWRVDLDVQAIVRLLQREIQTRVVTGQIVLNMNEGRLQSFETKTYAKVAALDKMNGSGAL